MAAYNYDTPPRRQSIIPFETCLFPEKTEQYQSTGNTVVPANQEVQLMAAFTLLTFTQDPFKIKKQLTKSDVDGSSRLLLQRNWVEEHIMPSMNLLDAQLCRTCSGKYFPVFDVDDDSVHYLVLKKWKNTYFVFTGNRVPSFVTRKHLEAGDHVGIGFSNGFFFFKLLKKTVN